MTMKSKFLIVLYLAIIAVLGISCETTDNEPNEDAVITVIVNGASYYSYNGAATPYFEKTLYLFAGDIQPYLRTEMFDVYEMHAYDNIDFTQGNAIASATADSDGKFTFVIDKKYLYGSIRRAFAVAEFDENGQLLERTFCTHINQTGWKGCTSGESMEMELNSNPIFMLNIDNIEVAVNKQGAIKVRSEIAATTHLTKCYIATSCYDNLLYDFLGWDTDVYEFRTIGKGFASFLDTLTSPWIDLDRYGITLYADAVQQGKEEWDYWAHEYVTVPDSVIHIEKNISELIEYPYNSPQGRRYINIEDNATYTVTEAESKSVDVIADVYWDESNSLQIIMKKASLSQNAAVATKSNKVYMFQDGQAVDEITYDGVIVTENGCICKFVDVGNFSYENNAIACVLQMQVIKEGLGAVAKVDISELSN